MKALSLQIFMGLQKDHAVRLSPSCEGKDRMVPYSETMVV